MKLENVKIEINDFLSRIEKFLIDKSYSTFREKEVVKISNMDRLTVKIKIYVCVEFLNGKKINDC